VTACHARLQMGSSAACTWPLVQSDAQWKRLPWHRELVDRGRMLLGRSLRASPGAYGHLAAGSLHGMPLELLRCHPPCLALPGVCGSSRWSHVARLCRSHAAAAPSIGCNQHPIMVGMTICTHTRMGTRMVPWQQLPTTQASPPGRKRMNRRPSAAV
jgi:hypothetical protein